MKKLIISTLALSLLSSVAMAAQKQKLADLTAEQIEASQRVALGDVGCEFNEKVSITKNEKEGYFDLKAKGKVYTLAPVLTTTGAVRLENATDGIVWIQIANKSMLMDSKKQKRIIDDCK